MFELGFCGTRRAGAAVNRLAGLLSVAALLGLAGCGSDSGESSSRVGSLASDQDIEVVASWAKALSDGDLAAAAEYFAIPSVAQNGPALVRIDSTKTAETFNGSLPCGAILGKTSVTGDLITATFELTERPGRGRCGPGVGGVARVAFRIEDGLIVEWRRVGSVSPSAIDGQVV